MGYRLAHDGIASGLDDLPEGHLGLQPDDVSDRLHMVAYLGEFQPRVAEHCGHFRVYLPDHVEQDCGVLAPAERDVYLPVHCGIELPDFGL